MTDPLSKLDRVTLFAWRGANMAGWPALAFLFAMVLHFAVVAPLRDVHSLFDPNLRPGVGEFLDTVGKFGLRAGMSLGIGLVVGRMVGSKVWRYQTGLAILVAAVYVLLTTLLLENSVRVVTRTFDDGVRVTEWAPGDVTLLGVAYDLLVAATVAVAAWSARRTAPRP